VHPGIPAPGDRDKFGERIESSRVELSGLKDGDRWTICFVDSFLEMPGKDTPLHVGGYPDNAIMPKSQELQG
jgi:hypothetical protein